MNKKIALFLFLVLLPAASLAQGTRLWTQSSYDDFEKGTSSGVAIRSDGVLYLAPSFRALSTTASTYIWSIASDPDGNVYVASGSPARVYRVTPDGKTIAIFRPQELQVQSLVVAPDGTIYAATSPDGKVYRIEHKPAPAGAAPAFAGETEDMIDPSWSSSVYFDPKTKYIWDLALDPQGRLFVATGDHGQVFCVEKNGVGSVYFKSDEAHIRVLEFDTRGNLLAGSDGSGLIYRISPDGTAFVLYSANKKEITALAVDPKGNIYAAGVGDKRPMPQPPMQAPVVNPPPAAPGAPGAPGGSAGAPPAPIVGLPMVPTLVTGGSEVYRISTDGTPQRIWSSRDDIAYALAFDAHGNLLVGTGNKGHVYAIANAHQFSDLVKASANQVTAFAAGPKGSLYLATSNLGKIFTLGAEPDADGTFESDVFDAKIFSRWGRAEVRSTGVVDLYARSGNVDNPDRNWSAWQKVDLAKDSELNAPSARFVQWKLTMRPGIHPATADSVGIDYRPNNMPPEISDVTVQVGSRFTAPPRAPGQEGAYTGPPSTTRDRDIIGVRWNASDPNDDELAFSVYYRGDGEERWKLLKDGVRERFCSFDSTSLPDGGYTIRVVASDAPSHSPDEAMSASDESAHFDIDNTPPAVENLAAIAERDQIHVNFHAVDNMSPIKRAEYSLDGGAWQFIEPVGLLSDSRTENYDFNIALPGEMSVTDSEVAATQPKSKNKPQGTAEPAASTEHTVAVRVYDRYDNMGSAKALVRTK